MVDYLNLSPIHRYRELFLEDQSELEAFNAQRLYAPFLWGRALSPDDHDDFFSAIVQTLCGPPTQCTDRSLVMKVRGTKRLNTYIC